uniref:uncharacterized protein LOC120345005 isoform X1 n=2 Tax=Styela clava TaxID=7725 RepID=UPI00193A5BD7|nr:uncharacterized protein LOC120345005 isoform X1 [Styela clava]
MEKARRKRINNCLGQLRSLLPFTNSMKRDMASLLEQTVEYINTMHTVLNEEKPACLSRVYMTYQKKIEEYDFCRKSCVPKSTKKKFSSVGGICSHSSDNQSSSPVLYQGCSSNPYDIKGRDRMNTDAKRHCSSLSHDQSMVPPEISTPTGPYLQNWHPSQQIIEPTGNINNNNFMPTFLPCGSDCRSGILNSNHYIFEQSPLPSQYGMLQKQSNQYSPHTSSKFLPPLTKMCTGMPRPLLQYGVSTSVGSLQGENVGECSEDSSSDISHKSGISVEEMISKNRKPQNFLNVSSLVESNDQGGMMQMNPSPWRQHDFTSVVPFNPIISKSDNPTHNLLAPMDMSLSPPSDAHKTSPQFMGVSKLCGGGFTTNREMGIISKPMSVSNMLNEVTGINSTGYSSKYGSSEHKVTQMTSLQKKYQPSVSQKDSAKSTAIEMRYSSAPVVWGGSTPTLFSNFFTPPSSHADKLIADAAVISPLKSDTPDVESKTSTTKDLGGVPHDSENVTPESTAKTDENNNLETDGSYPTSNAESDLAKVEKAK